MLEKNTLGMLAMALEKMAAGYSALPEIETKVDEGKMQAVLLDVAERMQDNYPYFHPLYAGQMLKPPHPVARLAYMLSLWINPNNHALDGGKASSALEKEAVSQIAAIFGWEKHLGHLTSGGTFANQEALWISGKLAPGKLVVASEQAHYTHKRISEVLGLPFQSVPCNRLAKMDLNALEELLKTGRVGTVVATIGTTGVGSLDPLPEILELRQRYGFRLHADAAYGGYYALAGNLEASARRIYERLGEVDSLVIDPHKHGLQPYGCGCILFRDPAVGRFYKHESPYTYFTSAEMHLGEISLECSRAGASAVALWATQQMLPMQRGGEFAQGLEKSRRAALAFYEKIAGDGRFKTMLYPELDILVWAPHGASASEISKRSEALFLAAAGHDLHLATFKYPMVLLDQTWADVIADQETVTCMRSVLMKPEHEEWLEEIWVRLDKAVAEAL